MRIPSYLFHTQLNPVQTISDLIQSVIAVSVRGSVKYMSVSVGESLFCDWLCGLQSSVNYSKKAIKKPSQSTMIIIRSIALQINAHCHRRAIMIQ